jgi:hypothetical protein
MDLPVQPALTNAYGASRCHQFPNHCGACAAMEYLPAIGYKLTEIATKASQDCVDGFSMSVIFQQTK